MKLNHFEIDETRHKLVVDVEFYQMDLNSLVQYTLETEKDMFSDGIDALPSWSKFAMNPLKAKGFWVNMLQSIFEGKHNFDELNLDYQSDNYGFGVYMMFLPGNMKSNSKNNHLKVARDIAQATLKNFHVIALANSLGFKNKNSQEKVKNEIQIAKKNGKNVLILSTCLAQRSFSVGDITAVFLAYDNGEVGATIQKMSRTLTPDGTENKVGRVISLSFDPNRDDKFDSLILQTAVNYKNRHNINTTNEAIKLLFQSVDIFNCTGNGRVKINVDEYLYKIRDYNRIPRIVGKSANVQYLLDEDIKSRILSGDFSGFSFSTEKTLKGKTFKQSPKNKNSKKLKSEIKEEQLLREKIVAICENLDIIVFSTSKSNVIDALNEISNNNSLQKDIEEEFGMPVNVIRYLIDQKVINLNLLELNSYE